jgi:hypothetical protein
MRRELLLKEIVPEERVPLGAKSAAKAKRLL